MVVVFISNVTPDSFKSHCAENVKPLEDNCIFLV